ncbi:hypothetical protein Drorol1_Dr00015889 [Drosera rotundifolia]
MGNWVGPVLMILPDPVCCFFCLINCVLRTAWESGLGEYAEKVFDEMSERGVGADCGSFRAMVVGYCRLGLVAEADRWMSGMVERKFVVDHVTRTLVISKFCEEGLVSSWFRGCCKTMTSREVTMLARMEPLGGAHNDPAWTSQQTKEAILDFMAELDEMDTEELLEDRRHKFRKLGGYEEGTPTDPEGKSNVKKIEGTSTTSIQETSGRKFESTGPRQRETFCLVDSL